MTNWCIHGKPLTECVVCPMPAKPDFKFNTMPFGGMTMDQPKTDAIPIILYCPQCHARHIDKGEFAEKPHHTHACQVCGFCWRPAIVATVGVAFLPGFKDVDP